jgi:hypothetical protein
MLNVALRSLIEEEEGTKRLDSRIGSKTVGRRKKRGLFEEGRRRYL